MSPDYCGKINVTLIDGLEREELDYVSLAKSGN